MGCVTHRERCTKRTGTAKQEINQYQTNKEKQYEYTNNNNIR